MTKLDGIRDDGARNTKELIEEFLQKVAEDLGKYPEGSTNRRYLDGLMCAARNLSELVEPEVLETTNLSDMPMTHIKSALREAFHVNTGYDGSRFSPPFFINSAPLLAIAAYLNTLARGKISNQPALVTIIDKTRKESGV